MSALRAALVRQFRKPSGLLGRLAGLMMSHRASNRARNRWTLDLLALKPNDRVLEFGCGPGFALALAADRTPEGAVTGVDHSETMIDMARQRISRTRLSSRIALIVGDDRALDAFAGALDVIYSANAIQFLGDQAAFFGRAAKALAPGGRIATTYQPRGEKPSPEQAVAMAETCWRHMASAGFVDIHVEWLRDHAMPAMCILGQYPTE